MDKRKQLTLSFQSGISGKYRSLLECCAAGVYKLGLQRIAGMIDAAPSNLSTALSGQGRKFGVDDLEDYIDKSGDLDPVFYLVDKFLNKGNELSEREMIERLGKVVDDASAVLREYSSRTPKIKAAS